MVAICHPAPRTARLRPQPSAAVYRRRRLVAAGLAVLLLVSLLNLALFVLGESASPSADATPVAELSVVVEPGDTVWSIAESLADGSDVRPVVDALVEANGGPQLAVGDRLVIVVP